MKMVEVTNPPVITMARGRSISVPLHAQQARMPNVPVWPILFLISTDKNPGMFPDKS